MPPILTELQKNPYLSLLDRVLRPYPQEIYIVGGFLRDLFLERKKDYFDLDFAISSSAIKVSRQAAKLLKSGFVVLDKEHGSTRIVFRNKSSSVSRQLKRKQVFFDFTDYRGNDIVNDLEHRDFSINSMAVNLRLVKKAGAIEDVLLDPYGARKDIKRGLIRVVSAHSFLEDPLRILRAFSLSSLLDFKIEPKTKNEIKRHKKRISSCAFERVTEEFFKILNSGNAFRTISLMDEFSILDEVIPELKIMRGVGQGPYHHLDVYRHSLETLRQLEILFEQLKRRGDIQDYLNQIISANHTRRSLLKFGALLHDIGKPDAIEHFEGKIRFHGHERIGRDMVRGIAERLRLSNDEREMLSRVIFWHLRPGYLADMDSLSSRAAFRYFRDTGLEAVAILLLSIADQRSTRGPLTRNSNRKHHENVCLGLVKDFFRKAKAKKIHKLLNGHDLIKHLKLSPGPLIGKILTQVEEAQALGEVRTKSGALKLAKKLVK